ncbi:MAG: cyanase [Chromatiaceae bacterium]|nr:cyanase [Gammaproteobacteria bacterium]MCP5300905.1 cyanase [Chromatiaceae bacterium]MCP5421622.1 cyanase [Chromatiaceae bacterium]
MTLAILAARKDRGMSWEALADAVGLAPVFLTSACLGMNSLKPEHAARVADTLGLDNEVSEALQVFPHKHWDKLVPTDPVIYRLYEIVGVYGDTIKEIIHEKFGDGIMSAIDFSMHIDKEQNPAGDRVVISMNGKFLPYKSW